MREMDANLVSTVPYCGEELYVVKCLSVLWLTSKFGVFRIYMEGLIYLKTGTEAL